MQQYILVFVIGGLICVVGQLFMDLTPLTPAHILVLFVTLGAVLSGFGLYQPLIDLAGAGATIPLPGFGHGLVVGVLQDVDKSGILGLFTGAFRSAAAGLMAAVLFGFVFAVIFNPKG
jgi:stage V sporulation protein AE